MKPSLFDNYHYFTYSLQISAKNMLECGFCGQKTSKKLQNCIYLSSRFFESARYKNAYNFCQE